MAAKTGCMSERTQIRFSFFCHPACPTKIRATLSQCQNFICSEKLSSWPQIQSSVIFLSFLFLFFFLGVFGRA
ncbi:unnamed protein product [Coffea canephora]|uniref:Uncharacterized protein n=1 Tax=Coffea canephora TaxID=49390 RepID=A0A068UNY4_COFCA|nr:unnamed protein product [Coffea canephora]